ncbi:hypothetical protein MESMUL_20010 [Mesosutterella multiformis]|uniref:Uncharacterized protein n=1 Tax=Mesosutterella multiformis TaxID=2259133 RepID=A0A388SE62_9BURK|nr:hypothetical protein MESMUL_20010 [Mesosutterella multiformis]GCB31104.1 hypothetical protein KGMB02707_03730 [Mesosutterella multiformis]
MSQLRLGRSSIKKVSDLNRKIDWILNYCDQYCPSITIPGRTRDEKNGSPLSMGGFFITSESGKITPFRY